MAQVDDLSRSFAAFKQNATLVAVLELSPFISRMWTWWVRRSSRAPVSRSLSSTSVHSSNGKLLVTSVEPRS